LRPPPAAAARGLERPYADPGEFLSDVAADTVFGQRDAGGAGGDPEED
jgi:hypothetical protein